MNHLSRHLVQVAQVSVLIAIAALPFSTALLNIAIGVAVLAWLCSGIWRQAWASLKGNPWVQASLALFALLLVGMFYPGLPWKEAWSGLMPYRKLLFVPVLVHLLAMPGMRHKALVTFASVMAVTLALSYLHVLWPFEWADGSRRGVPWDHSIFKHHLIQNIFMSFAAVIWINEHRRRPGGFRTVLFWVGLLALLFNIFVLVEGRTGHLALAVVLVWYSWALAPPRQRTWMMGLSVAAILALGGYLMTQETRLSRIGEEIQAFKDGKIEDSSSGQRLEFWKQSWLAIKERPLLGWGTGSYSSQYCKRGASAFSCKTGSYSPHNQYIFLAFQLGAVGLLAYLGLLLHLARGTARLPEPDRFYAWPLLLMLAVHSMFDAALFVVAEGHFYVLMISLAFSAHRADAPPRST